MDGDRGGRSNRPPRRRSRSGSIRPWRTPCGRSWRRAGRPPA